MPTVFGNTTTKNGKEIENSEHVVNRLENPNIFQSRNEFLTQWFIQRCLYPGTFHRINAKRVRTSRRANSTYGICHRQG
jgi:hypothetical protein